MAKKKLFKSKGNFTIKRLHQSGSYGNIYERDYTTIANTSVIPSGQIPIYSSPSFKLSIRGNTNNQKKYRYSNWVNNPLSCDGNNPNTWTLGCMPKPNKKDGEIVLKLSKKQLLRKVESWLSDLVIRVLWKPASAKGGGSGLFWIY